MTAECYLTNVKVVEVTDSLLNNVQMYCVQNLNPAIKRCSDIWKNVRKRRLGVGGVCSVSWSLILCKLRRVTLLFLFLSSLFFLLVFPSFYFFFPSFLPSLSSSHMVYT